MAPITKTLLISLLACTALAAPSHHGTYKHRHRKHATGTGSGKPCTSGAPYALGNSTAVGPTGTGTGAASVPVVYSTMVVLPIPASDTAAAAAMTTPAGVNHGVIGSETDSECPPGTVYVTASNTMTVTVPYEGVSSNNAAGAATSTAVDSSSPSATSGAPYGLSNATDIAGPSNTGDSPIAQSTAGTAPPNHPYNTWTAPLVSPPAETPSSTAAAAASSSTTSTVPAPLPTEPASSPAPVPTESATSPVPVVPSSPAPVAYTPPAAEPAVSSTAAAKAPTSAKAPASAPAQPTPVDSNAAPPSGAKRGLVYNTAALCAPLESSNAISWAYNWGSDSAGLSTSLEYVPMLWGLGGQQDNFVANTKAAIAKGSKYIMAFNEPDMVQKYGGSDINPSDAAKAYKQYMQPFKGQAALGAPAVTNANQTSPPMGIPWLKEFTKQCGGDCPVDFYPLHWYGWANGSPQDQAKVFKEYILTAKSQLGGKSVWVTEFSALPLEDQTVNSAFMDIVLPWLDSADSGVDRYSYFMVSDGSLVQGGSLTAMGKAYVSDS